MNYFVVIAGQRSGPFPHHQLVAQGLRPDTLVWREGMADWMPASLVPELQSLFPAAPPPYPQAMPPYAQPVPAYAHPGGYAPPYPPDIGSKKILAGIMALLFGGLGIHKFILGMPGPGVAMILISILGGAATCGVCWVVMHVIGLIEGILYLTKSDPEFFQVYMVEKRGWF